MSTRAASAFRTKGCAAVGFSVFGTSILLLNCHLTAHAGHVREREKVTRPTHHHVDVEPKTHTK